MGETTTGITALIEAYEGKCALHDELSEEAKRIKAEMTAMEKDIVDRMADMAEDAGLSLADLKITVGNKSYAAVNKQQFSILAADREVAFEGLRLAGFGWLIQETIASQSLNKAMREQAAGNGGKLPPELATLPIKLYETPALSARTTGRRVSK